MNELRRRVLQSMLFGGAAALAGCERPDVSQLGGTENGRTPSLLILGGTGFVGPHVVRTAVERGFEVTLFNRGRTAPELFPELELLVGDRRNYLDAIQNQILQGRVWDSVIDLSGYVADQVTATARMLGAATNYYLFISTVVAYANLLEANDESSPLYASSDGSYGPEKAEAERRARAAMPGRVGVIRPTYVAGPGDNTDRLTYWPVRVSRGGEMLVPGPPDRPVKFIDVRDLAAFIILCAERRLTGAFNAVPPSATYTMAGLIEDCEAATGQSAQVTWVTPEFVRDQGIEPDVRLPIWESPIGATRGVPLASGEKAAANGLETRLPAETIRDTFLWWQSLPERRRDSLRAGLPPDRETQLLAEWHRQAA